MYYIHITYVLYIILVWSRWSRNLVCICMHTIYVWVDGSGCLIRCWFFRHVRGDATSGSRHWGCVWWYFMILYDIKNVNQWQNRHQPALGTLPALPFRSLLPDVVFFIEVIEVLYCRTSMGSWPTFCSLPGEPSVARNSVMVRDSDRLWPFLIDWILFSPGLRSFRSCLHSTPFQFFPHLPGEGC